MRIKNHPILKFPEQKRISFIFDGREVYGFEGDTVASALHDLGVKEISHSIDKKRPRGFYCAIGNCASCNMIVNGVPNVRTCVTKLEENMVVVTQENRGELYDH